LGLDFRARLPADDDYVASDRRTIGPPSSEREKILSCSLGRNSPGRISKEMTRE
jgi:hypothetical protein